MSRLLRITILLILLTLASCQMPGASPTALPELVSVTQPAATTAPTVTEKSGDTDDSKINFVTYDAPKASYSIAIPKDWTINEDPPNVQFTAPNHEALVQVTYSDLKGKVSNDKLADIASMSLKEKFGDRYVELGRNLQAASSMRIDFDLKVNPLFNGSVHVEQHGTGLYMLFLIVQSDKFANYVGIFEKIVLSYTLSEKTTPAVERHRG